MEHIRVVHPFRAPWLQYLMVALCLVSGPWIFYEWNRQWTNVSPGVEGWEPNAWLAAQTQSAMQMEAAFRPVTDVLVVLAAHEVSRPVELTQVEVRRVTADGFWVSQYGTPEVFVAFAPNVQKPGVQFGQAANVSGTVQALPAKDQRRARWPHLGGDDLRRVEQDGVYIQTSAIEVTGWY